MTPLLGTKEMLGFTDWGFGGWGAGVGKGDTSGPFAGWWMRTSGQGRATEGSGGGSESDCWSARSTARSPPAITVEAVGRNDGEALLAVRWQRGVLARKKRRAMEWRKKNRKG